MMPTINPAQIPSNELLIPKIGSVNKSKNKQFNPIPNKIVGI